MTSCGREEKRREPVPSLLLREPRLGPPGADDPGAGVLEGAELGPRVLELGPGPGLTTEVLAGVAPELTAIELDPDQPPVPTGSI